MKNIQEIQRNLSSLKDAMHNAYGVSSIEIFGSFVRGEQREDSDIDVLVDFDRDVSLLDVSALQVFLTEQLGAQIDVVLKRSVRKELKDRIFAEAVPV
jgi:hypothetical protein